MNQYQQEFIQNLKELRCQKQFSQAKLSELCNVATGTIGNIECGISKPSFDLILNMARVLDVHPATLFSKHSSFASADSENKKMLAYALQQIQAGGIVRTGQAMAVTVITISVPIIFFIFSQSQILETMATSGLKD